MDKVVKTVLFSWLLISLFASSSYAQNCNDYRFSNNNLYTACNSLPVLSSFLHWNYHQSNHSIDIAYRHTGVSSSDWVVWSLNPDGGRMVGAQCLVAFRNSSGRVHAYTAPIAGLNTQLQEGPLSFRVPRISAEFTNNQMVSGDTPMGHATTGDNLRSFGTIDFATGLTSDTGAASGGSRQRKRNVHGVINVVSWGILMPVGAMLARYLKVFKAANPAWFYLHVACQVSGYAVGVAGWGTGLKLGSDSPGVRQDTHRNIGITLFALGTLQVFALLLRPKPDHKFRFYWNIYHYSVGYTVIILSIVNIFEGFDILDPEKKWKRAYIGVLIFLGATTALLEAFTWYVVLKRKRENHADKVAHAGNGMNGYNGGSQQAV
ncbi:unnamed protein product [Fraxinus pennsylvanica]|uniref:Cytochrome b561 and DOMON domain-containing protein n=1 Tax=Fraxinus pennsylvanica TaxID=56036 RepID=A0AAD2A8U3_9LAMI|nr:unnamed protein product [Fraxinus pennsylvanica]